MIFPIANFVPIKTTTQLKHSASVAIRTRSSSHVITKQPKFCLIAIAMANASEKVSLSGSVSDSRLRRELETPTAKSWGEPCSVAIESLINLGPAPARTSMQSKCIVESHLPWNRQLQSQLEAAGNDRILRWPFLHFVLNVLDCYKHSAFEYFKPDTKKWDLVHVADSTLEFGPQKAHGENHA